MSFCTTATDDAIEEIVKGERCWGDGRKQCTIGGFSTFNSNPGDCYAKVACMCNRQCLKDCEADVINPFEKCASMKCMCDLKKEEIQKVQESYFSQPLKFVDQESE